MTDEELSSLKGEFFEWFKKEGYGKKWATYNSNPFTMEKAQDFLEEFCKKKNKDLGSLSDDNAFDLKKHLFEEQYAADMSDGDYDDALNAFLDGDAASGRSEVESIERGDDEISGDDEAENQNDKKKKKAKGEETEFEAGAEKERQAYSAAQAKIMADNAADAYEKIINHDFKNEVELSHLLADVCSSMAEDSKKLKGAYSLAQYMMSSSMATLSEKRTAKKFTKLAKKSESITKKMLNIRTRVDNTIREKTDAAVASYQSEKEPELKTEKKKASKPVKLGVFAGMAAIFTKMSSGMGHIGSAIDEKIKSAKDENLKSADELRQKFVDMCGDEQYRSAVDGLSPKALKELDKSGMLGFMATNIMAAKTQGNCWAQYQKDMQAMRDAMDRQSDLIGKLSNGGRPDTQGDGEIPQENIPEDDFDLFDTPPRYDLEEDDLEEKDSEQDTEKASEQDTEKASEQDTEKASEQDTEEAPEPDTEEAPEPDTEEAPEPDTEEAPEPDTEEAPEQDTEKDSEQDTEEASEQDAEEASEQDTEEASEQDAEEASEQDAEEVSEQDTEKAPSTNTAVNMASNAEKIKRETNAALQRLDEEAKNITDGAESDNQSVDDIFPITP